MKDARGVEMRLVRQMAAVLLFAIWCAAAQAEQPSVTIVAATPIASSDKFVWRCEVKGGAGVFDESKSEIEIRTADNSRQVARIPGATGNLGPFGVIPTRQLRWMGSLPDGDYVAAVNLDGKRISNVAAFKVDSTFKPENAPTLALVPLPSPDGTAHSVGLMAVGPDPANPAFNAMNLSYPPMIVDGMEIYGRAQWWGGMNPELRPGERWVGIVALPDSPDIQIGAGPHRIAAYIGSHRSAEVVVPSPGNLEVLWDAAATVVKRLSDEEMRERAAKPFTVAGTVRDGSGSPLDGIEITIVASNRRLIIGADGIPPTQVGAVRSGADGTYEIHFAPGKWDPSKTVIQDVEVTAAAKGLYEKDLSKQGFFIITDMEGNHRPPFDGYVRPAQTKRVDFVMLPAATVHGKVTHEDGKPGARERVAVALDLQHGVEGRTLAETVADAEGRYTLTDVPLVKLCFGVKCYPEGFAWQTHSEPAGPHALATVLDYTTLERPGAYEIDLVCDTGMGEVAAKVVKGP